MHTEDNAWCAGSDQECLGAPGDRQARCHRGALPEESLVCAELQGMSRAGVGKNKGRTFQKGEMACPKKGSETDMRWASLGDDTSAWLGQQRSRWGLEGSQLGRLTSDPCPARMSPECIISSLSGEREIIPKKQMDK